MPSINNNANALYLNSLQDFSVDRLLTLILLGEIFSLIVLILLVI